MEIFMVTLGQSKSLLHEKTMHPQPNKRHSGGSHFIPDRPNYFNGKWIMV